ncbi:MAG: hypothetical protein GY696_08795 [Gammaproteobacteria bacterium]|nr:hypothetical protein [Gammaproteobacteria bacterium]
MPQEISWEIRGTAEDLYIIEGLTYEEVAHKTGVSVSQLKRWGKDEDWTERKKEYREELRNIKRNTVKLKSKLLTSALEDLSPQLVYAFSSLESATKPKVTPKGNEQKTALPDSQVSDRDFNSPADAIEALEDALKVKINKMVSVSGELNFSAIKDLKQSLELLEQMKVKYKPDVKDDTKGGLSDEAAEAIRKQILGIKG